MTNSASLVKYDNMDESISILNKTKGKLPSLPFVFLKNDILNRKYALSIAFVGEQTSRKINKEYRNKDKSTNILSFNLSENSGELILCPTVIKREAKNFDRTYGEFMGFLVIHGMLHLKGMQHGSIMELQEKKYDKKYFYRHRHRLLDYKSRSSRIPQRRKIS
ncbi:MAG: rRNA maturation RNase YbeY [bacterium]|nr:rRNA maturation RNase YbeY [bacterium]